MNCSRWHHEYTADAKFCEECAAPLSRECSNCGAQLRPNAKICSRCAHPVDASASGPEQTQVPPKSYTPKYLADKILTSRAALEGERKQVTVLFADLTGSMELLADRDPEGARSILDRVIIAHCYAGLGRRKRSIGQQSEAREDLTRACAMYREMDMRFYLGRAQEDLAKLS